MKKIILFIVLANFVILNAQETNNSLSSKNDLFKMNIISVTIGGAFITNGSFPASMTERVDQFITRIFTEAKAKLAGSIKDDEVLVKLKNEMENFARRDITLKRFSGEIIKLDLDKFRLTGNFDNNPYLKNDDVLIFPAYDIKTSFIEISGAVNKENKFQFVDGDNLSDAILFAGGLNLAYDNIKVAEISRLNNSGDKEEIIPVDVKSNYPLKRGDRIRILSDENQKKDFKMLVLGEVKRPGYVYITKNATTIREVIQKAGGFTSNADLKRSEYLNGTDESQLQKMNGIRTQFERDSSFTTLPVLRKTVEELLTEDILMTRSNNLLTPQLQTVFYLDNAIRFITNKSSINFENILQADNEDGNLIVKDGDMIVIPTYNNKVYVFGQVMNPGYYIFKPQQSLEYYIEKAGGKTERADDDEKISLIKGTNRSWIPAEEVKEIESGDMIYIPKNIPKGFDYYLQQVGTFTSILTTLILVTFSIIQATK